MLEKKYQLSKSLKAGLKFAVLAAVGAGVQGAVEYVQGSPDLVAQLGKYPWWPLVSVLLAMLLNWLKNRNK